MKDLYKFHKYEVTEDFSLWRNMQKADLKKKVKNVKKYSTDNSENWIGMVSTRGPPASATESIDSTAGVHQTAAARRKTTSDMPLHSITEAGENGHHDLESAMNVGKMKRNTADGAAPIHKKPASSTTNVKKKTLDSVSYILISCLMMIIFIKIMALIYLSFYFIFHLIILSFTHSFIHFALQVQEHSRAELIINAEPIVPASPVSAPASALPSTGADDFGTLLSLLSHLKTFFFLKKKIINIPPQDLKAMSTSPRASFKIPHRAANCFQYT